MYSVIKNRILYIIRLVLSKKGQGMVEYAFIIGFIALTVIFALGSLGSKLADFFTSIVNSIPALN